MINTIIEKCCSVHLCMFCSWLTEHLSIHFSFARLFKPFSTIATINQNLKSSQSLTLSVTFDLTVGCLPLCPTHWPSRAEVMGGYHEYTDVKSCQDVVHLYYLLWSATILNIVALFLGIITAAVLGGFKDMVGKDMKSKRKRTF